MDNQFPVKHIDPNMFHGDLHIWELRESCRLCGNDYVTVLGYKKHPILERNLELEKENEQLRKEIESVKLSSFQEGYDTGWSEGNSDL